MMIQRDSNPWPPRYLCDALPTELWSHAGSRSGACMRVQFMDPLHIMGMQPIWRTKQKKFSFLGIEIYSHVKKKTLLFCPPDWLYCHGRAIARGHYPLNAVWLPLTSASAGLGSQFCVCLGLILASRRLFFWDFFRICRLPKNLSPLALVFGCFCQEKKNYLIGTPPAAHSSGWW